MSSTVNSQRGTMIPRIKNPISNAIAVPKPNCTMAWIPATPLEMNAAADDMTANISAGNTKVMPRR